MISPTQCFLKGDEVIDTLTVGIPRPSINGRTMVLVLSSLEVERTFNVKPDMFNIEYTKSKAYSLTFSLYFVLHTCTLPPLQ